MGKTKIPTILAIVLLVVGLATGVFLVQQRQAFRLSASPNYAPQDMRITNITDTSFTVSWFTEKNSSGFIEYGLTTNADQRVFQEDSSPKRVHYITVENLKPDSNYYFKINSGGDEYDNSGIPWSVKTAPTIDAQSKTVVLSGQAFSKLNTPAANIAIYAQIGGAQLMSTKTSENGNFVLPLTNIRTQNLDEYFTIEPKDTLIQLVFQGGPLGTGFVQTYLSTADPLPLIFLNESYDLRSRSMNNVNDLPEAKIELPNSDFDDSNFNIN